MSTLSGQPSGPKSASVSDVLASICQLPFEEQPAACDTAIALLAKMNDEQSALALAACHQQRYGAFCALRRPLEANAGLSAWAATLPAGNSLEARRIEAAFCLARVNAGFSNGQLEAAVESHDALEQLAVSDPDPDLKRIRASGLDSRAQIMIALARLEEAELALDALDALIVPTEPERWRPTLAWADLTRATLRRMQGRIEEAAAIYTSIIQRLVGETSTDLLNAVALARARRLELWLIVQTPERGLETLEKDLTWFEAQELVTVQTAWSMAACAGAHLLFGTGHAAEAPRPLEAFLARSSGTHSEPEWSSLRVQGLLAGFQALPSQNGWLQITLPDGLSTTHRRELTISALDGFAGYMNARPQAVIQADLWLSVQRTEYGLELTHQVTGWLASANALARVGCPEAAFYLMQKVESMLRDATTAEERRRRYLVRTIKLLLAPGIGRLEYAVSHFAGLLTRDEAFVSLEPIVVDAIMRLSCALIEAGRLTEAQTTALQLFDRFDDVPDAEGRTAVAQAYVQCVGALRQHEAYADAIVLGSRAERWFVDHASPPLALQRLELAIELGQAFWRSRRLDEARRVLREAISGIDEGAVDPAALTRDRVKVGSLLFEYGEVNPGTEILGMALAVTAHSFDDGVLFFRLSAVKTLASMWIQLGEQARARTLLHAEVRALIGAISPFYRWIDNLRGWLTRFMSKVGRGTSSLRALSELDGRVLSNLLSLVAELIVLDSKVEALRICDAVIDAIDPEKEQDELRWEALVDAWRFKGFLWIELRGPELAIHCDQTLLEMKRALPPACAAQLLRLRVARAERLLQLGWVDEAIAHLEAVISQCRESAVPEFESVSSLAWGLRCRLPGLDWTEA